MDQATPTTGKTERVRRMFDGIADRYDFANKLMTLGIDRLWRRRTARWGSLIHTGEGILLLL